MIGTKLAHYEITDKLGEGGMGVVYRATDTKLNRDVAIKLLPDQLTHDSERMERFRREAQLLAQLNHPSIAGIHGVEDSDEQYALVMELAEGQTLAERLDSGPIPVADALPIAKQIAEALEAAHERGIIHRDLKPANIKVSEDGQIKVLDFGLAKALEGDPTSRVESEHSPTLTMAATQAGIIMGTPAYMSPEQARGKTVDKRADIWSFGVVLYEMLTGRQMFGGETVSDSLAGVLRTEIDHSKLPKDTPPAIRKLLRRCLERDHKQRLQAIGDARIEIEEALSGQEEQIAEQVAAASPKRSWLWPAVAALTAFAFLALAIVHFSESPPPQPVRRFSFTPPPNINVSQTNAGLAISPNGRHIAFTTSGIDGALWVQDFDQDEPRRLSGTEGASLPFWSPDSEFVGFATDTQLRKISTQGGAIGLVCQLPSVLFYEGTWSPDGDLIVFSSSLAGNNSLYEVSAEGDSPQELVTVADLTGATGFVSRPRFLPIDSARVVTFTLGDATTSTLFAKNLDTGQTEELGPGDRAVFSPRTGLLIYQSQRNFYDLWARPFSPDALQFTGPAFPVRENARQPSLSGNGVLAYLDGGASAGTGLYWVDRTGQAGVESPIDVDSANPAPALSPDGASVAYRHENAVWVHNLERGSRVRLTDDGASGYQPVWSPDGGRVAFSVASPGGGWQPLVRTVDGSGPATSLPGVADGLMYDWSSTGLIVFSRQEPESGIHLWYREVADEDFGEPRLFLQMPEPVTSARVSPDGRHIAYVSDESGRNEVYVQPFPAGGRRTTISTNGGDEPQWSPNGKELFYAEGVTLMSVAVSTGGDFSAGVVTPLFEYLPSIGLAAGYDVSPDGQRFIIKTSRPADDDNPLPRIRIVQNWYEEFRDRR